MILDNLCVFDFETTGLDPDKDDRVIEMAALRIRGGQIVAEFSALVAQTEYAISGLPPKITEITGITTEMMRFGIVEKAAFRTLLGMMQGCTLVAHNAAFDLFFLHCALDRLAGTTFTYPFLDTLTIARDRHTYPHKLEDMTRRYGIELNGAHRALNDVHACHRLLKAMHAEKSVDEWLNTLCYLPKYGPNRWYPEHAKVIAMENRYEPRQRGGAAG